MIKQITITELSLVTRTIEVEVPSYYNKYGQYIAITDEAVIKVYNDGQFYISHPCSNEKRYNEEIAETLKCNALTISKKSFEKHLLNTIKCLTDQYRLSMNMFDPNAKEPAQQAEGQEAAAESAAQDTAMEVESAEEGNMEG